MKRKDFIKSTALSFIALSLGSNLIIGCSDLMDVPEAPLTKEDLYKIIENSKNWEFTTDRDFFRSKRIILFSDSYSIVEAKKDEKNNDIDFILKINVNGFLKCNFDFYSEEFHIAEVTEIGSIKTLYTNKPNNTIKIIDQVKEMSFSLKKKTFKGKTILDDNYKLPCIMSKREFENTILNNKLTNIKN